MIALYPFFSNRDLRLDQENNKVLDRVDNFISIYIASSNILKVNKSHTALQPFVQIWNQRINKKDSSKWMHDILIISFYTYYKSIWAV